MINIPFVPWILGVQVHLFRIWKKFTGRFDLKEMDGFEGAGAEDEKIGALVKTRKPHKNYPA